MIKNNRNKLVTILLLMSLFTGSVAFTNLPDFQSQPAIVDTNGDEVQFSQLLGDEIKMAGPFDSASIQFNVPANWKLSSNGQLNLSMTVAFNAPTGGAVGAAKTPIGTLGVEFNKVLIGTVFLDSTGRVSQQFQIPVSALPSVREDGLLELRFVLDSGWSCDFDESMLLYIHNDSNIVLPHETITPSTDLRAFPSPIYQQDSFYRDPLLVVIPDKPTDAELQAALTVAAGFGKFSSQKLPIDINTISHLSQEQIAASNLILIGKAATLPLSTQFALPMPMSGGRFENPGGNPDDGIIEQVNSPWSEDKVILIVSGNTDVGMVKAAQAVSTGTLRSYSLTNLAVVSTVENLLAPDSTPVDQTLNEMGYSSKELNDLGVNYSSYVFYIPPGQTVSEDAYFELSYGHSALLQYERSGIVLTLNDRPVGSASLKEETAQIAANRVRFSLPHSAILPGANVLEIRFSLYPVDRCSNPDLSALYANIWSDSALHLPLTPSLISPITNYDLSAYPAPYAFHPTLDSTAFVLQKDDLESWRTAFKISEYLGDRTNGEIAALEAFYADDLPEAERSKYNFIIVGRPSKLPIVGEINDLLPGPFVGKSDNAREPQMQVNYRLGPDATVGYVEMIISPWNKDNVILMAVGNSTEAVNWAASYLIEPKNSLLAGNFAIVNDQKVYTADTRITTITPSSGLAEQSPVVKIVPPVVNPGVPVLYRPVWLIPLLGVSSVLILLTIIIVAYSSWAGKRSMSSKTRGTRPPSEE